MRFTSLITAMITSLIMGIFINAAYAVPPKANLSPSDYSTGISYFDAVKMQKPMIVNFYVDWCGYCRKFAPILESLKNEYKNDFNFVLVNCDDPKYDKLMRNFAISGFPTLYIVDPRNDNRIMINQALYKDRAKLKVELDRFLKVNK